MAPSVGSRFRREVHSREFATSAGERVTMLAVAVGPAEIMAHGISPPMMRLARQKAEEKPDAEKLAAELEKELSPADITRTHRAYILGGLRCPQAIDVGETPRPLCAAGHADCYLEPEDLRGLFFKVSSWIYDISFGAGLVPAATFRDGEGLGENHSGASEAERPEPVASSG